MERGDQLPLRGRRSSFFPDELFLQSCQRHLSKELMVCDWSLECRQKSYSRRNYIWTIRTSDQHGIQTYLNDNCKGRTKLETNGLAYGVRRTFGTTVSHEWIVVSRVDNNRDTMLGGIGSQSIKELHRSDWVHYQSPSNSQVKIITHSTPANKGSAKIYTMRWWLTRILAIGY